MFKPIKPFTFVRINHNKLEKEHGISKNDVVFVAAAKAFPLSEEDPYTQRIFFFVQKVEEMKIDDESGFYVVDPVSLDPLDSDENSTFAVANDISYEHVSGTVH